MAVMVRADCSVEEEISTKVGHQERGANMKYVLALIAALALNATANLLIKFGMRGIEIELDGASLLDGGFLGLIKLLLRHWEVLAGLTCFAMNVVFYAFALQKLPISVAYPIMVTTGFAIIVVIAGWKLHERLTAWQWAGVIAILIGVGLVAKDAGKQMGGGKPSTESACLDENPCP
jgi:multidrug transporter EmrE-like cation transporter